MLIVNELEKYHEIFNLSRSFTLGKRNFYKTKPNPLPIGKISNGFGMSCVVVKPVLAGYIGNAAILFHASVNCEIVRWNKPKLINSVSFIPSGS